MQRTSSFRDLSLNMADDSYLQSNSGNKMKYKYTPYPDKSEEWWTERLTTWIYVPDASGVWVLTGLASPTQAPYGACMDPVRYTKH